MFALTGTMAALIDTFPEPPLQSCFPSRINRLPTPDGLRDCGMGQDEEREVLPISRYHEQEMIATD